jgi:hypothetical protein
MKTYIDGYYCRDDLHLQIMNKDSNRRILEALRDVYPEGLSVEELAKQTKLPVKTIYAQKAELYREYYINHFEEGTEIKKRGRPHIRDTKESLRKRVKIVIEEASGIHDAYEGKKPVPLPPGNILYTHGFTDAWHDIVARDEEEELCKILLQFIEKIFNRMDIYGNSDGSEEQGSRIRKRWAPGKSIDFCCSQCGLNHEARDFIRATLLHLIDQLEKYDKFIDFLKNNQYLTQEAYERIGEKKRKEREG